MDLNIGPYISVTLLSKPKPRRVGSPAEMDVSAATVAGALSSEATRVVTLDALEALAAPIPSAVALAAALALVDVMATEKERAAFDRCTLLLGRLLGWR